MGPVIPPGACRVGRGTARLATGMMASWPNVNWRRQWRTPLVIALLLSLALHLYVWLMAVLLQAALQNGWLPPWLERAVQPMASLVQSATNTPPAVPPETWQEIPLQLVEVDPALVTEDAPDATSFFSTANTQAANPDPAPMDQGKPRIDGWREDTLKTFDTPRPIEKPEPAQPKVTEVAREEILEQPTREEKPPVEPTPRETPRTASAPPPAPTPVREEPPKVEPVEAQPAPPGETLLAKVNPEARQVPPVPLPDHSPASEPQDRTPPRKLARKRLAEVMPSRGALVGERMRQDGNVPRMAVESSLDVKASPLGDYHYRMVLAVQQQWYRLLEERRYALERMGKVVISFDLHSDGTITGLETKNSDVGDVLSFLCELSVMQPAPFGRWPAEIRRLIGGDVIPVTFTFNYY